MMDSAQFPVEAMTSPPQVHDVELENKVKRASEKISENLHIFANEPSLACYRLQEHIQKSLPQLVLRKPNEAVAPKNSKQPTNQPGFPSLSRECELVYQGKTSRKASLPPLVVLTAEQELEVNQIQRELQGKCYDLEYSINALKSMQRSQEPFLTTQALLQTTTHTLQVMSHNEMPKGEPKKKPSTSMYQRFSGSFDLPSSFLPSGLSSSVSASADLKSTAGSQRTLPSSRRARASSVSSTPPPHASASRAQSASCSPTLKKSTSP